MTSLASLPTTDRSWPDAGVSEDLGALRTKIPLVQCVTNIVVTNFTANVLLAVGASPAMVIAEEEVEPFAAIADAVLVNVGTVTSLEAPAMVKAARAANAAGTPWVLDPIAYGALEFRTRIVDELLEHRPTVIRGNGSEIGALAGGEAGKGADSTQSSDAALEAGIEVARRYRTVVAISGATDYITDGQQVVTVTGGDVLMTRITGTGCSLGATIAAFTAVSATPLDAAVSASAVFAQAAERGVAVSHGTGTLAAAFLDNLGSIA